jgi:hypothetical protein
VEEILLLPNGFESARVARMPPLPDSTTDKNVCPTERVADFGSLDDY